MPTKYAIQFAFDGTDYCGWQKQKGTGSHRNPKPSIEEKLVEAIEHAFSEVTTIVASGRTDAGVHASGQVAHFTLTNPPESEEHLTDALNEHLPDAIRVLRIAGAPASFKAQQTLRKQYSYYFQQGPANLPHLRNYTMWNRRPLDTASMNEAAALLVGEHDFFPFCGSGANVSSTTRIITEAEVTHALIPVPAIQQFPAQDLIRLRLVGSGFLKHMVRSIAGTLRQIGEGTRPPSDIRSIIDSRDRELAGPTAPASGLWLDQIRYADDSGFPFPQND